MRFIYLSKTQEAACFGTKSMTVDYFGKYFLDPNKVFNFSERKIAKNKFEIGEDIFFLLADKDAHGEYTYLVMAYCKSASTVVSNNANVYPYNFNIDRDTLKIFEDGIDVKYFNEYVYINKINNVNRNNYFSSNIENGTKFTGPVSWLYFGNRDSQKIMKWFKELIFNKTKYFK